MWNLAVETTTTSNRSVFPTGHWNLFIPLLVRLFYHKHVSFHLCFLLQGNEISKMNISKSGLLITRCVFELSNHVIKYVKWWCLDYATVKIVTDSWRYCQNSCTEKQNMQTHPATNSIQSVAWFICDKSESRNIFLDIGIKTSAVQRVTKGFRDSEGVSVRMEQGGRNNIGCDFLEALHWKQLSSWTQEHFWDLCCIMKLTENKRVRSRTTEQLIFSNRLDWHNLLLPKLHQLLSRRMRTVVKRRGDATNICINFCILPMFLQSGLCHHSTVVSTVN